MPITFQTANAKVKNLCAPNLAVVILILLLATSTLPLQNALADSIESTEQESINLPDSLNRISLLIATDHYQEALTAVQEALLSTSRLGKSADISVAKLHNYAGWLNQKLGRAGQARSEFESAIKLCEALQTESESSKVSEAKIAVSASELAVAFNNLGTLLYTQGDYASALYQFERALKVNEKHLAANDIKLAQNLKNLAGAMDACGRGADALKQYQKAIAILEDQSSPPESELAQTLDDYACSLEDKGHFEEALKLFERALALKEKLYGPEHIELSSSLNNIGVLKMDTRSGGAELLFDRALTIAEKSIGPDHIELVAAIDNRGDFDFISMNYGLAEKQYLRAAAIIDRFFSEILPYCSNAEKQALFDQYSTDQVSRLLSLCKSGAVLSGAYETMLSWKGSLVSSLACESRVRKSNLNDELRAKAEELSRIRSELSANYLNVGNSRARWEERNTLLTRKKEELERALSSIPVGEKLTSSSRRVTLSNLQASLKPGEALVDVYAFDQLGTKEGLLTRTASFGAIITCKDSSSQTSINFVELGQASTLRSTIQRWEDEVQTLSEVQSSFQLLNAGLKPIFDKLPAAIQRVWICPDSDLARIPWTYVAESNPQTASLQICQIDSANELCELRNRSGQTNTSSKELRLTVLGGADFGTANSPVPLVFPPLPGTLSEANKIAELAKGANFSVLELTGKEANKSNLMKSMAGSSYVHLATHGFFFDGRGSAGEEDKDVGAESQKTERAVRVKSKVWSTLESRNPLVESGLALAGANNIKNDNDECINDGILTAEELVDADLHNCKILVLSACDTGRGKQLTGQGVLGLRSSAMAAGCKNVLMSLWKIPDDVTVLLMEEFYRNLWQKRMTAAAALKDAQKSLRDRLGPAIKKTKFWAGWVLVGEGW